METVHPPGSTVVTQYICVQRWHRENSLYFGRVINRPRASGTSSVIAILTIWMENCQSGSFLQTNEQETHLTTAHLKHTEMKPFLIVFFVDCDGWPSWPERSLVCILCSVRIREQVVEFLDPNAVWFSGFICLTRPTDPSVHCQIIQPARQGMAAAAVRICNCRQASELKWS